jgi:hypothetical protein
MGKKDVQIIVKVMVILLPTYIVAYLTNAMIYTMPMLAACTLIAASLFDDDKTENRVDEDGSSDSGEIDGGDLDGS